MNDDWLRRARAAVFAGVFAGPAAFAQSTAATVPAPAGSAAAPVGSPAAAAAVAPGNPSLPVITLLFAPTGPGRLGEELLQELVASGFAVGVARPGEDALAALQQTGGPTRAVVTVAEGVVTIHARTPGADVPRAPIELRAETHDRPTRRRLCLAVVERLRRLESEEASARAVAPSLAAGATVAPGAPATGATASDGGGFAGALPGATPPPGISGAAPSVVEPPRRRPWALGFASAVNLISSRGTPSGHVLVAAEHQLSTPFALALKAAWPVLAAHVTDGERSVRTWTFAAEAGAVMRLLSDQARLRPTLGVALGLRGALADTDEFELRSSHLSFVPALSGAVNLGLRFRVRPLIDIFLEADLSQAVALVDAREYERSAATERVLRTALGVLFEY